jgi:hypothetical protein
MKTIYRLTYTALFNTKDDRNAAYSAVKTALAAPAVTNSATFSRSDLTKDDYLATENESERLQ